MIVFFLNDRTAARGSVKNSHANHQEVLKLTFLDFHFSKLGTNKKNEHLKNIKNTFPD